MSDTARVRGAVLTRDASEEAWALQALEQWRDGCSAPSIKQGAADWGVSVTEFISWAGRLGFAFTGPVAGQAA